MFVISDLNYITGNNFKEKITQIIIDSMSFTVMV